MDKPTCSIDGCEKLSKTRGWCGMHYVRWQRHGDPLRDTLAERRGFVATGPVADDFIMKCKLCGTEKVAALFPVAKNTRSGRVGTCKRCVADRAIAKWRASPDLQEAQREYKRKRWVEHPELRPRYSRERYLENRDKICARQRLSESTPERRAKRRAYSVEYNQRPEVILRRRARNRAWQEANAERYEISRRAVVAKRNAALRGASAVPFTSAQLKDRLAFYGFGCWMCGAPYEHIDHVKPIARGGVHMLSNLRPACSTCNYRKSFKWEGPLWTLELKR